MNIRSFLEAVSIGGKTAFLSAAFWFAVLVIYGTVTGSEVIYLQPGLMIIAYISVILGGLSAGMADGTLGWLQGGVVAVFYLFAIMVLKAVMFPIAEFGAAELVSSAGILLAGAFGGVTGINLRPLKRQKVRRKYLRG
ncbi:TIGR04086 family membrane protein [Phosphitispora sp. TUW77]|uniref:TIGR04086 family membrane protein n=1 Tax=Phosphitispora sp. TUW77 TaxID=3152361 RepID=UPI003AB415C3